MAAIFSRILCPIDFEHDSMDALGLACQLAKQNSATVYLLTVIGAPPPAAAALPPGRRDAEQRRLHAANQARLREAGAP